MKRCFFIILFFVAVGMYSQNLVKTYTFSEPTIKLCEECPEYCYIDTDDGYVISILSEPEIPSENVIFYIPEGKDVESVEVSKQGKRTYNLSVPLKPGQEPIPTSLDYVPSGFTEPSHDIYNSDNIYPPLMAEVIDEGYMFLTNKVVNVRITPYEYYPLSGRLDFFSSVTVEIKLKNKSSEMNSMAMTARKTNKDEFDILKKTVENPEDLNLNCEGPRTSPKLLHTYHNGNDCLGYEYVVITSEELAPAFESLIDWKRRKGLDAGIVTMEYIKENYNGDEISGIFDDAGKLRQFLYESYLRGTIYVLLGGDKDVVPIRYGYYKYNNKDEYIPTDIYFAEFNGNWNVDGDDKFGESHDDVDYMQEIYVGRILCSNANEVNNWIEKALIYEQKPGLGDYEYLNRSFITEADQMMYYENYERFVKGHFPMFRDTIFYEMYNGVMDSDSSGLPEFPTGRDVIEEFNKNYGLVSFFGHGSPVNIAVATFNFNEYWGDDKVKHRIYCYEGYNEKPDYNNGGSLEGMSNWGYPNINYSISCSNVDYGEIDNLGKYFTSAFRSGCVAFLGNTNFGFFATNTSSDSPLLFSKFGDAIQCGFVSLGVAEALSKIDFNSEYADFLRYSHNLIGCPEMNMWVDAPKSIDVEINKDEVTGRLSVKLPTPDYRLCIMSVNYNEQPYQAVASDFTDMTFSNLPSDYTVVITRDGYLPYKYTVRNNVYLQNIQYNNVNRLINGYTVTVGYNVDPNHPEGNVVIKGSSNVIIDAESHTEIKNGFNVEKGSVFIIK